MKSRKAFFAAAVILSSFAIAPSAALADVYYVQCDSQTCYEIACGVIPNINGTGNDGYGCAVVGSFPRPNEVSGG